MMVTALQRLPTSEESNGLLYLSHSYADVAARRASEEELRKDKL